jgi:hypothetical protein
VFVEERVVRFDDPAHVGVRMFSCDGVYCRHRAWAEPSRVGHRLTVGDGRGKAIPESGVQSSLLASHVMVKCHVDVSSVDGTDARLDAPGALSGIALPL